MGNDEQVLAEAGRVNALTRQHIDGYAAWGSRVRVGEVTNDFYDYNLEFVNLRIETADSCLALIKQGRIADALGLCRSLLEHYLLFQLMCRGTKFYRLQQVDSKRAAEVLVEEQAKLEDLHAAGEHGFRLEVRRYPKNKAMLMHVLEGFRSPDGGPPLVPAHFLQFREFRPDVMRLDDADYFTYFDPDPDVSAAKKGYRNEATDQYTYYLSYDAMIRCLQLNDLLDDAAKARLEAHYTFLGQYLHPTHDAVRRLCVEQNVRYALTTAVGLGHEYAPAATLLASLYLAYLVDGLLDEACMLLEAAPEKYIRDAGTGPLRELLGRVPRDFPYFWFLFNEAPAYDRYVHATSKLTAEEWAALGDWRKVPGEAVTFHSDIYGHLQQGLGSYSNIRCGIYEAPLPA